MSTIQAELYDALIAIKVPEDKARAAAVAVAKSDEVATKIDISELKVEMAELKNKLILWIAACTTIIIAAIGIATTVIIAFITNTP